MTKISHEKVEVVIAGSGIAGSTMAAELGEAGFNVLVLEAGPERKLSEMISSQIWSRRLRWAGPEVQETGDLVGAANFAMGWGTGGAGLHWYANWYRLHPDDFHVRSQYGRSLDWPISYEELQPWYDHAQVYFGVSGREDPSAPPSASYPMPAIPISSQSAAIKKGFDAEGLTLTSNTLAARFEFSSPTDSGDGLVDYNGPFKRDFCLEDLAHGTLAALCREFMLDVFLLNYACHYAIGERHGVEHLVDIAQEQYHHLAPITVHRLRNAFGIEGDDMAAILKILQLNYFAPHEYFDLGYAQISPSRGLVWLGDCAGSSEPVKRGIASLMMEHPDEPGFHRLAEEVNPRAVVRPVAAAEVQAFVGDKRIQQAWEIVIDAQAEPATRSDFADVTGKDMWDHDNSRHVYLYDQYDTAAS